MVHYKQPVWDSTTHYGTLPLNMEHHNQPVWGATTNTTYFTTPMLLLKCHQCHTHFHQHIREGVKKSKWKLMAKFPDIFYPTFFSFAIESYIYETDFTLQKYHF